MKDYLQRHGSGEGKPTRVGGVHGPAVMRGTNLSMKVRGEGLLQEPRESSHLREPPTGYSQVLSLMDANN